MAIANGSFETQATGAGPGDAEGWTVVEVYTAQEFAEFTHSAASYLSDGQETFEGDWPDGVDDGLLDAFAGYYDDLDPAVFDTPANEPVEDFEERWGTGNQGPIDFNSLPAEAAVFDSGEASGGEVVEDYEEGWPTGQVVVRSFAPADLEFAAFDVADDDFEDFEQEWDANEDYIAAFVGFGTDLSPAYFATGYLATGQYESFNSERFDLTGVTFDPATDTWTKVAHGLSSSPSWTVTLLNSGGRLPDGYLLNTEYRVQNATADTFQLAATDGGTIIDGLDVGYGTHSVRHDPGWWWTVELTGV